MFASDRAKFDPGEIYSLALARAPRNVSRSLAGDYGLAVAPTGDQIAFWSGRTGTDRVYLARSDGSHLRRVGGGLLSRTRGSGGALDFSADGKHLYARTYDTPRPTSSTRGAPRRAGCRPVRESRGRLPTERSSPAGSTARRSCPTSRGTCASRCPAINGVWSSRGWLTSAPPINESARHRPSAVVVDPSGRVRARFGGLPLAFSPDGRWLVLKRGNALWVAGPGDFTRLRVLLPEWPAGVLSFTPDSRFVSTESSGSPVLVPLAGGRALPGLDFGTGAWSRDGRLAYVGYTEAYANARHPGVTVPVFVTDTHGRNPRVVGRFPFDDHNYSELHWLPDGRSVLFLTGTTCGGSGLFAVPAGGGATRRLDHDPRNLETPTWSPDGTRIAVSVQNFTCHLGVGLPSHIATVAPDGSDARRVTDDGDPQLGSFDRFPSFSPDGSRIAFAHGSVDSGSIQITAAGAAVSGRPCSPTPMPSPRYRSGRRTARGSPTPSGGRSRPSRRAAGRPR